MGQNLEGLGETSPSLPRKFRMWRAPLSQEANTSFPKKDAEKSPFTSPESEHVHLTVPDLSWIETNAESSEEVESGYSLCIGKGIHENTDEFVKGERKRGLKLMRKNRRWFTDDEIHEASLSGDLTWLAVQTTMYKRQKEANERAIWYNREYDLSLPDSEPEEQPRRKRVRRGKA